MAVWGGTGQTQASCPQKHFIGASQSHRRGLAVWGPSAAARHEAARDEMVRFLPLGNQLSCTVFHGQHPRAVTNGRRDSTPRKEQVSLRTPTSSSDAGALRGQQEESLTVAVSQSLEPRQCNMVWCTLGTAQKLSIEQNHTLHRAPPFPPPLALLTHKEKGERGDAIKSHPEERFGRKRDRR